MKSHLAADINVTATITADSRRNGILGKIAWGGAALPSKRNRFLSRQARSSEWLKIKSGVEEKINLQRAGTNAKPYQVKNARTVILKARLGFKQ